MKKVILEGDDRIVEAIMRENRVRVSRGNICFSPADSVPVPEAPDTKGDGECENNDGEGEASDTKEGGETDTKEAPEEDSKDAPEGDSKEAPKEAPEEKAPTKQRSKK